MNFFVVCYDISDDAVRGRVAKILARRGYRVQKSVFEISLHNDDDLLSLQREILAIADRESQVSFYSLCERCRENCASLGGQPAALIPVSMIV